jgi:hypothetical protein
MTKAPIGCLGIVINFGLVQEIFVYSIIIAAVAGEQCSPLQNNALRCYLFNSTRYHQLVGANRIRPSTQWVLFSRHYLILGLQF